MNAEKMSLLADAWHKDLAPYTLYLEPLQHPDSVMASRARCQSPDACSASEQSRPRSDEIGERGVHTVLRSDPDEEATPVCKVMACCSYSRSKVILYFSNFLSKVGREMPRMSQISPLFIFESLITLRMCFSSTSSRVNIRPELSVERSSSTL